MTREEYLALANMASTQSVPATTAKATSFVVYSTYLNENYVGNFSVPENFTEGTKEAVLNAMKLLGLELRIPGATKRELSIDDLLPKAKK